MKKNLVILVVALAVLVAVVWFKKSTAPGADTEGDAYVPPSKKSSLTEVVMTKASDTAGIKKVDGEWVLAANGFPADTGKVNPLLDALFDLSTREVVSRNPERAGEYGLDSASRKSVILKEGDREIARVLIGKVASTDFNSTYWKKNQGDEVYRTPGSFARSIVFKEVDWADKKFFDFEEKDISGFDVYWKDSSGTETAFTASKDDSGKWEIVKPSTGKAKPAVETMANRFQGLQMDEFTAASDSVDLTTPPTLRLTVRLAEGASHTIEGFKHDTHYYVKHPNRDEVVKISKWRLELFEKTLPDVVESSDENESSGENESAGKNAVSPAG